MEKRKERRRITVIGDAIMLLIALGGGYALCHLVSALLRALGVG